MAMEVNYYEILEVPKDASAELIREAYKKMAIKWHPDKNMDNKDEANARFKKIAQAYQVLSDNDKRFRYDRSQNSDDDEYDDSDDSFDRGFDDYFGFFMTPDILFRLIFRQYAQDMQYSRQRMNNRSAKNDRRANGRRHEHRCYNDTPSTKSSIQSTSTTTRMVNGKRWVTKKYYEDGKEIITRHEDGELVSKHIDGVAQDVSQK